ncbi:methylated-DNA--[protein]-cysteine S-methyltransferase [Lactobacillus xylocopicola]|uniref:6-O-methylguanine DNA methyltransferase n=1 Tax=Lactobacillus xylocopicola TaxID=2976676 RepID=A0ABN6SL20_9LACO|nr:methylated-DNA--[protein]-cysteine S-methyltransferase [Lactobacillus xylocopicola]BDR61025.1 6-O-methylguanine DNA methyltransferase [Lactobacillus xylocopicola]
MLHQRSYQSNLGKITLLSNDYYLLGLWFAEQKYYGAHYNLEQADNVVSQPLSLAVNWLNDYFAGRNPDPAAIPIKLDVTPFRQKVLGELQKVPYGQTVTYKELSHCLQAGQTNKVNQAQAIGGAVGHNPLTLIIPCHRVIGSDGSLTGYAGGIERKRALLRLERQTS